jgi:hypothetical protein
MDAAINPINAAPKELSSAIGGPVISGGVGVADMP